MKTKPTTNRRLIVRTYLQTILNTTVLSLLLTTGVMSALLFSNSTTSANKMVQSLEKTFVHVTPNTDAWQASSQQGASTTYVKIRILPTTSTSAQTFYSTGSKNFTQQTAHHLSSNFLWVKGKGLFVYRQQATTKAVYHVWLSLDETLRELGTVLIAILLVSLLSTSLGIILINLLSRRITKPLTDLTAAVILAHNHPSGMAEPSRADREITSKVAQACALLNIRLLDHLVIGHGEFTSFAERGWL